MAGIIQGIRHPPVWWILLSTLLSISLIHHFRFCNSHEANFSCRERAVDVERPRVWNHQSLQVKIILFPQARCRTISKARNQFQLDDLSFPALKYLKNDGYRIFCSPCSSQSERGSKSRRLEYSFSP